MGEIIESCRLSWGDKNRIERAVDQCIANHSAVKVTIEHNGVPLTVLITRPISYTSAERTQQAKVGFGNI